ncbi:phosphonate ABC transporter ATP-binding protein [Thalassobacillus devorans]|uniref:phosphonate ABC transporter ATP-binding protein n=1 Tax=Thalassobacillus devorans TaxID=279813 RepID=UPI00048F603C|nr:ATP-binding cassette domain-containing protein [Thalassobacillus devorans]
MTASDAITIEQAAKRYGGLQAIAPMSLRIKKGEVVALIGPSGAGKSTLLNMLAAIELPDTGTILLDEKTTSLYRNPKDLAKKAGIIRQQFDLVGPLPVIHNVLAGKLADWGFWKSLWSFIFPQEKQAAMKALERVGLSDKIYDRTARLSGGEQQRVALARLLVQNPEVILADEPVSSLDPARAKDIIQILVSLAKSENKTLVASLHSLDLAKMHFDRVIALRDGQIFFDRKSDTITTEDLTQLYQLTEQKQNAT